MEALGNIRHYYRHDHARSIWPVGILERYWSAGETLNIKDLSQNESWDLIILTEYDITAYNSPLSQADIGLAHVYLPKRNWFAIVQKEIQRPV